VEKRREGIKMAAVLQNFDFFDFSFQAKGFN